MTPTAQRAYNALNTHTQIGVPFSIAEMARIMQRDVCITITKYDVQNAARFARDNGYATSENTPRGGEAKTLWTRIVDIPAAPKPCEKTRVDERRASDVHGGGVSNRTNRVRLVLEPWEGSA